MTPMTRRNTLRAPLAVALAGLVALAARPAIGGC